MPRLLTLLFVAASLACTPGLYKRDVTATVTGPAKVAVGESVLLAATLEYSDGSSWGPSPSVNASVAWASSDTARASVDASTGRVTGVAPGEVTITATPSATTTGTGRRLAGTLRLTVTE
jgi:hypothetical protein